MLPLYLQVSSELAAVRLLYRTEDLTVGEKLGEGAFGVVCKGDLLVNGRVIPVAVKSIKGERKELLRVWDVVWGESDGRGVG